MNPIIFLISFAYLFVVGVWAAATNRRWVFLTAFGVAEFSVIIFTLVIGKLNASNISFLDIFEILIWGLCFELFLFQIRNAQETYSKILWSVAGGLILFIMFFSKVEGLSYFFVYLFENLLISLALACNLLSISYVSARLSNALKKIWPTAFDV